MSSHSYVGKVGKRAGVGGHDGSTCRSGGGGDEQVMGASGPPLLADGNEQMSVSLGDGHVVAHDWDGGDHAVEEVLPSAPGLAAGELDTDQQLGNGDCCDGDIVIVGHYGVELIAAPVRIDEEGGVGQ